MDDQPAQHPPSVVVIGNFDGVHTGHVALIETARAARPDLPVVAVTFWPHPQSVIAPALAPAMICTLDDRIALLTQAGVDSVRVVTFDEAMKATSAQTFVTEVLEPLHPQVVVVGTNFRFGAHASGDSATLTELSAGRWQVIAAEITEVADQKTCSTRIREAIAAGQVAEAATLLGRPYRYVGVVCMGHQRGRELGFPTANLPAVPGVAVPAPGVYAGWVTRLDEPEVTRWPAAISVGLNPTFDDVHATVVEAHVLDRDDLELYGVQIAVDFVARVRDNEKFSSIEELVAQIGADVAAVRVALASA